MSLRSSGILLHPTSLPSPFGIGDLGAEARAFVDFLHDAAQTIWQTLPLGPSGFGNSPYQALSAFAGNPLLIDPRQLIEDGWLDQSVINGAHFSAGRVKFEIVRDFKERVLHHAFHHFKRSPLSNYNGFEEFCDHSSWWLTDYATFRALKDMNGGSSWTDWHRELAQRDP
ncbi:MAG TPA: 4-alpha-glucanotransferase, partial [Pyrinomonadaceae bacterium]|nr:4-alpha-glucanotransferase [Pyrinomonadaceae bacterium]